MEVTIGLAFAAGFISFISPCVLPLVPAYIGYMGGRVTNTVAAQAGGGTVTVANPVARLSTVIHSLFFVLGFALVFVGLGLASTAFLRVFGANVNIVTNIIGRAGGIIIIFLGLHFMGAIPWLANVARKNQEQINILTTIVLFLFGSVLIFWAFDIPPSPFANNPNIFDRIWLSVLFFAGFILWFGLGGAFTKPRSFLLGTLNRIDVMLYADTRKQMASSGPSGFGSSTLMGIVFAAGWTPCIGPIYGAILTLAANGGDVTQAGTLLFAYSLGLGIPFIVTAFMLDGAQGVLRRLNRQMGKIKLVSGAFLILIGVLVASNQLQRLSTAGSNSLISYQIEECFVGAVSGDVAWGRLLGCINQSDEIDESTSETPVDDTTVNAPLGSIESFTAQSNAEDTNVGISVGDVAPNFTTVTHTGEALSLADLRGQAVLLNFWATWCGPCRVEMPEFQDAYEALADDGLVIIAVNNRENAAQITEYADELGLTFPLVLDLQGSIQDLFVIGVYPSTLLIDENGVIVNRHQGVLTAAQIQEMLDAAVSRS